MGHSHIISVIILIAGILYILLFLGFIFRNKWRLKRKGIYSIGTIKQLLGNRESQVAIIDFPFRSNIYSIKCIAASKNITRSDVGKRIFVKFIANSPTRNCTYSTDNSVPDGIGPVPFNGWTEIPSSDSAVDHPQ